jgi:hypothetical protein
LLDVEVCVVVDSFVDVEGCVEDSALRELSEDEDEPDSLPDAGEDSLAEVVCLVVEARAFEADASALLAGRSAWLELPWELLARLLELAELLFAPLAELVVRPPEPVVVAPLDLPGKACAASSAKSAVSARLAAISQRLARARRRRAESRVWVVCLGIVSGRRRVLVSRDAQRQGEECPRAS